MSAEDSEDFEANRQAIETLCSQHPNDVCNDCGSSGTRWVSVNHGVFVCIRCSGIHRSLGTHVSKVKSTNMDKWTQSEIAIMRQIGNTRGKQLFEARFPKGQRALTGSESDAVVKQFIQAKYENKTFADEDWMSTLKRVYKAAGYKSGLKALKALPAPSQRSEDFVSAPAEDASPAIDKKEKKEKKSKKDKTEKDKKVKKEKAVVGVFGVVTVAKGHDEKRAALLAQFGVVEAAAEEAEAVAAPEEEEQEETTA